jgi:Hemerythrin HHE cation binding domain
MKSFSFASNQERDRYLEEHFRDRRDTVTPYAFDVPGGTISVFEKTIVFEPQEGQGAPEKGRTLHAAGPREETRPVPPSRASDPAGGSAGAFASLREDHHKILALLMKIRTRLAERDADTARGLFDALKDEVELHSKVEDLHVYRIFQQADSTRDAARRALAAHTRIQELLDAAGGDRSGEAWTRQIEPLHEALERHIDEEQRELFDRVGGIMTREEAHELGVLVETARRQMTGKEPEPAGGIPRG